MTLTNGCTRLVEERSYYTTENTQQCGHPSNATLISQPADWWEWPPITPPIPASSYLHISLSFIPPLSLPVLVLHCLVELINGRCQKCCQSILCLFGFIWTSGEVWGGDEGMKVGGERGLGREKATWWEVVTERGAQKRKWWRYKRRRIMGAAQLSSAARLSRRTSGTHRPITGALLISTQRALCQKSDTVQALWTSSPFKSTRRAFYVLNWGACAHVMVCDFALCSLSEGQRAPWWTKRREMSFTYGAC